MILDDLQTPALLVHLDRVRSNIAAMLAQVGGDAARWRPHVKTTKIPEVLDLLLAASVRRFKCATTREAAVLLSRAREPIDLLVAMAHQGANLRRCIELSQTHSRHRLALLTESASHAAAIRAHGPALGLYLDLDPGYHRTGIPLDDHDRILATLDAAGPAFRGLHFYEGHILGGSAAERARRCAPLYDQLLALADRLVARTGRRPALITSGTPTFAAALAHAGLRSFPHEVSPGTVVYFDTNSQALELENFTPAVTVLTRIISAPTSRRVTGDAGSKAIDAAAGTPCAIVHERPDLRVLTPSEEHLPLEVLAGASPQLGDLLQLVPRHVCPTVNLASQAVLLEGARIQLIVPVAARGHDLSAPA